MMFLLLPDRKMMKSKRYELHITVALGSPYFEDSGNFCPVLPLEPCRVQHAEDHRIMCNDEEPDEQEKMHFHLRLPDVLPLEEPAGGPVGSRCLHSRHRAGVIIPLLTGPSPGYFMRR
jgi:hypothetical protein